MSPGKQDTPTTDVQTVRSMFAGLDLPVCDDEKAVREAVDAQRDARNRQLNSTKGSVAVQARSWFDQVDALLNRRAELVESLYEEFRSLADSVLACGGSLAKKRLSRTARKELPAMAARWLGAREDLAGTWTERYLEERKGRLKVLAMEQPDEPAPDPRSASRRRPGRPARPPAPPESAGNRKVMGAVAGAVLIALTVGVLYQTEGLPAFEPLAAGLTAPAGAPIDVEPTLDGGDEGNADDGMDDGTLAVAEPSSASSDPQPITDGDAPASAESVELDRQKVALLLSALARKVQEQRDAQTPPSSALQIATLSSPDVSFGGHELTLAVATSDLCTRELHDVDLRGLRLDSVRRTDVGLEIVFQVNRLGTGKRDARASWSFRLSDNDGAMSDPVTGSCRVLPGGW